MHSTQVNIYYIIINIRSVKKKITLFNISFIELNIPLIHKVSNYVFFLNTYLFKF